MSDKGIYLGKAKSHALRPHFGSKESQERWDAVLDQIRGGMSTQGACRKVGLDPSTLRKWLQQDETGDLQREYIVAKEEMADALLDKSIDELEKCTDSKEAFVAKIKSDGWLKAIEKAAPMKYNRAFLNQQHTGEIHINRIRTFEEDDEATP